MTSPAQTEPQEAVLLPPGLRVLDVAERARSAALEFVHTSARWNKSDLVRWLLGPYAQAMAAQRTPSANTHVDDTSIERARQLTRLFLEQVTTKPTSRMADELLKLGLVCRAVDRAGGSGYVPLDRPDAVLGSRVLALFAADFLTRPRDYKDYLRTCRECDEWYFAWDHDEGPPCHSSVPSGVRARGRVRKLGG
jgi:hypothetical protein